VQFHFDDEGAAQLLDVKALLAMPDLETHVYVCGPAGFIELVKSTAAAHGWRASHIRFEHLGAVQQDLPAPGSFDVTLASSGKTIRIDAGVSVTDALAKHGVTVPVSCMEGVCGTCITGVLDGIPEHRDCYFSEEEKARNNQFMPCCSRARSTHLVLDL
jgi:vanillate monooxygenase ferredoxin subunit